ncbi:tetratricopeptide repeat protein [Bacillus thuringiensis]|uniref:tetratricopeptide repeat protein n=1 Tax=Bacillus thuringiensis TaxID=1428 RepID=UPI001CCF7CFE|nr:hypothetical protein [Bacillus thuringiensis]MBZ8120960.1 hypothetical protein [Bacillus thuringiensis]
MEKIDSFLVNLDTSGNVKQSSFILLKIIENMPKENLYVINYSSIDIKGLINQIKNAGDSTDSKVSKIEIVDLPVKDFSYIKEFSRKLNENDFIFIIGGEKLINYSETKSIVKGEFNGYQSKVHHLESEDWDYYIKNLEEIYSEFQKRLSGIFLNISVNQKVKDKFSRIADYAKNFSISCIEISEQTDEYENLQRSIVDQIPMTSLQEIFKIIDKHKGYFDSSTYNYLKVLSYIQHGSYTEAVIILEENYVNLRNEEKLILANLYIQQGVNDKAKPILNELYENDKYLNGLLPAILLSNMNSDLDTKKKWIEIAREIDPKNPAVLEFYASYLSKVGENQEAAKIFRELKVVVKEQREYYELVARINDLICNPPSENAAIAYIMSDYENNVLANEARFRLVTFLLEYKESYYAAYSILRDANIILEEPRIQEITKFKLDILKDTIKASKALGKLKVFKKDNHKLYLIKERMRVILESIPILSDMKNGYLIWKNFIDESQNDSSWRKSVSKGLIEVVEILNKVELKHSFNKSYINLVEKTELDYLNINEEHKHLMQAAQIKLLRRIKSGKVNVEDYYDSLEDFIRVTLSIPEIFNDVDSKLWCRYYLSIILSLRGENQKANDIAISLFEYSSSLTGEYKYLSIYLGLIAWANSQYRIGRIVEGSLCLISAIKFSINNNINEFYPIFEEGINLVSRFISDNKKLIGDEDKEILKLFSESISEYNSLLKETLTLIGDISDESIEILEKEVLSLEKQDMYWAIKITNLIGVYIKQNLNLKAISLIEKFSEEIINNLSNRMDIRYRVLYNWANFYFYQKRMKQAIEFLEVSILDIEKLRDIDHKEERAGLAEFSNEIYRFYVQICGLLYSTNDISEEHRNILKEKLLKIIPKLSPLSIIEQKRFNSNKNLTPKSIQLEKKLSILKEEYKNLLKENNPMDDLLLKKAKEIEELTLSLKKTHPYYKKLSKFRDIDLNNIKNSLEENEIFYQVILTPLSVLTLTITKSELVIKSNLITDGIDLVEQLLYSFSNLIQINNPNKQLKNIVLQISELIAKDLIQYVSINDVKKVYVMSDFKMGLYPMLISEYDGTCLIDKVESIINIIDYEVVLNKKDTNIEFFNVLNRVYGKPTDISLNLINEWLKTYTDQNMIIIENESDDVTELCHLAQEPSNNTVILYGHGVSDPNSTLVDGAIGVQGRNKLLQLDDILSSMKEINNFILISCRGGSPYHINPENSSGTWTNLLENFEGNIVACKWDVPTKSTIFLVENMLEEIKLNKITLDEALLYSQRKIKADNEYRDFVYWAGMEFWLN